MHDNKKKVFFDIEADDFLYKATTIWCIVAKLEGRYHIYLHPSGSSLAFPQGSHVTNDIDNYLQVLNNPEQVKVGHNIISYDLPLLKKLTNYEYTIDQDQICDTHILSRLFNPDRLGHSLEWFGDKFRYPKGDHNDFTQLTQEMLDYCIRDVDLTEKVYEYLMAEGEDWDWSEAIKLEYNVWHIQMKQEQHGVLFDKKKALALDEKIVSEIKEIEEQIQSQLPLFAKDRGELKKIFLKSGEYTNPVKEWINGV